MRALPRALPWRLPRPQLGPWRLQPGRSRGGKAAALARMSGAKCGAVFPSQCRRNLTRRGGTTEGGEHVFADAELQRPTLTVGDAETARPFLGKQADHTNDSITAHCAESDSL